MSETFVFLLKPQWVSHGKWYSEELVFFCFVCFVLFYHLTSTYRAFQDFAPFLTQHRTEVLVHALVTFCMDYSNSTLSDLCKKKTHLNLLQIGQNSAARITSTLSPPIILYHWSSSFIRSPFSSESNTQFCLSFSKLSTTWTPLIYQISFILTPFPVLPCPSRSPDWPLFQAWDHGCHSLHLFHLHQPGTPLHSLHLSATPTCSHLHINYNPHVSIIIPGF